MGIDNASTSRNVVIQATRAASIVTPVSKVPCRKKRKTGRRPTSAAKYPYNPRKINSRSGKFIGISWHSGKNKWISYINVNKKRIHLGYFKDEIEAAKAYDKAAIKHRGKKTKVNFP